VNVLSKSSSSSFFFFFRFDFFANVAVNAFTTKNAIDSIRQETKQENKTSLTFVAFHMNCRIGFTKLTLVVGWRSILLHVTHRFKTARPLKQDERRRSENESDETTTSTPEGNKTNEQIISFTGWTSGDETRRLPESQYNRCAAKHHKMCTV
jgi:flagellar biosynthesis/type III secretory pathway M-ring protein FliF/YscJ